MEREIFAGFADVDDDVVVIFFTEVEAALFVSEVRPLVFGARDTYTSSLRGDSLSELGVYSSSS